MGKQSLSTRDLLYKLDAESDSAEGEESEADELTEVETEEPQELEAESEVEAEPEGEEVELETDEGEIPADERVQEVSEPIVSEDVLAPFAMGPADRKVFDKLPNELKKFMADRVKNLEKGVNQYIAQIAPLKQRYTSIDATLQKHGNRLARFNMQPDQVIDRLLAWDEALQDDPVGGALQFLQSYGVQPQHLMAAARNPTAMAQQQAYDPRLDTIQQTIEQQQAMLMNQQMQSVSAVQANWASQRDESGMLKFPYAEELADTMAKCVPGLKQEDPKADINTLLTRAYNRALEYHPELKEALTAQREAARKKAQLAAQQKRRQEAKRAAITPKSVNGGHVPYTKKKYASTRDYLAALDAGEE